MFAEGYERDLSAGISGAGTGGTAGAGPRLLYDYVFGGLRPARANGGERVPERPERSFSALPRTARVRMRARM